MNFKFKLTKFNPSRNYFNSLRNVSTSKYLNNVQDSNKLSNYYPPCSMYFKEVECKVNEQIALEFVAFYNYLGMFNHFARSDVALSGCKQFFLKCAEEEKKHALKLCNYQNMRGGSVNLLDIEKPIKSFCTVKDAFSYSLQIEKKITEKLIELKNVAKKCDDCVTHDMIVNDFIKHQYKSIHSLNGYLKKLELLKDNNSGIYHFDKELFYNFKIPRITLMSKTSFT